MTSEEKTDRPDELKPERSPHWVDVFRDLGGGRLLMLAAYLRASNGSVDQRVAKKLADMIDGSRSETGWRLEVRKHPDLAPNAPGRERKFARANIERKIARFMASHGALEPSCFESAVVAATEKFGKKRSTVVAIWSRRKPEARMAHEALKSLRDQSAPQKF